MWEGVGEVERSIGGWRDRETDKVNFRERWWIITRTGVPAHTRRRSAERRNRIICRLTNPYGGVYNFIHTRNRKSYVSQVLFFSSIFTRTVAGTTQQRCIYLQGVGIYTYKIIFFGSFFLVFYKPFGFRDEFAFSTRQRLSRVSALCQTSLYELWRGGFRIITVLFNRPYECRSEINRTVRWPQGICDVVGFRASLQLHGRST